MSQAHKPKPPLDVLQSMVNGILIEVGKALRSSEKESGRTFASANTRLKTTIPSAVDNFQQALDELECDILRRKAVIFRDLQEKRAQRIARENPVPIPEPIIIDEEPMIIEPSPQPELVQDDINSTFAEQTEALENLQPTEPIPNVTPAIAVMQRSTPNPLETTPQTASKPVGLGINTEGIDIDPNTIDTPAPDTAITNPQSSVNSLFDDIELENENNENNDTDIFDTLDFSESQTLDFGNSNNTQNNYDDTNKSLNDMFEMGPSGGGDVADTDMGMASVEESTFDDMLWGDAEAGGADFDDSFFEM